MSTRLSEAARQRARKATLDPLTEFMEKQRLRIHCKLRDLEERVLLKRKRQLQATVDTRVYDCELEIRTHAHGHSRGPDWMERNQ